MALRCSRISALYSLFFELRRIAERSLQQLKPDDEDYLESKMGAANIGAVITAEGVLLIDPPPEPEIPAMMNALKAATNRAVRWVVNTDYQQAQTGGVATFLKQGAAIIGSKELDRLAASIVIAYPSQTVPQIQARPSPRFLFGGQLHLFPAGIEVRILAVKSKARTAGDVDSSFD